MDHSQEIIEDDTQDISEEYCDCDFSETESIYEDAHSETILLSEVANKEESDQEMKLEGTDISQSDMRNEYKNFLNTSIDLGDNHSSKEYSASSQEIDYSTDRTSLPTSVDLDFEEIEMLIKYLHILNNIVSSHDVISRSMSQSLDDHLGKLKNISISMKQRLQHNLQDRDTSLTLQPFIGHLREVLSFLTNTSCVEHNLPVNNQPHEDTKLEVKNTPSREFNNLKDLPHQLHAEDADSTRSVCEENLLLELGTKCHHLIAPCFMKRSFSTILTDSHGREILISGVGPYLQHAFLYKNTKGNVVSYEISQMAKPKYYRIFQYTTSACDEDNEVRGATKFPDSEFLLVWSYHKFAVVHLSELDSASSVLCTSRSVSFLQNQEIIKVKALCDAKFVVLFENDFAVFNIGIDATDSDRFVCQYKLYSLKEHTLGNWIIDGLFVGHLSDSIEIIANLSNGKILHFTQKIVASWSGKKKVEKVSILDFCPDSKLFILLSESEITLSEESQTVPESSGGPSLIGNKRDTFKENEIYFVSLIGGNGSGCISYVNCNDLVKHLINLNKNRHLIDTTLLESTTAFEKLFLSCPGYKELYPLVTVAESDLLSFPGIDLMGNVNVSRSIAGDVYFVCGSDGTWLAQSIPDFPDKETDDLRSYSKECETSHRNFLSTPIHGYTFSVSGKTVILDTKRGIIFIDSMMKPKKCSELLNAFGVVIPTVNSKYISFFVFGEKGDYWIDCETQRVISISESVKFEKVLIADKYLALFNGSDIILKSIDSVNVKRDVINFQFNNLDYKDPIIMRTHDDGGDSLVLIANGTTLFCYKSNSSKPVFHKCALLPVVLLYFMKGNCHNLEIRDIFIERIDLIHVLLNNGLYCKLEISYLNDEWCTPTFHPIAISRLNLLFEEKIFIEHHGQLYIINHDMQHHLTVFDARIGFPVLNLNDENIKLNGIANKKIFVQLRGNFLKICGIDQSAHNKFSVFAQHQLFPTVSLSSPQTILGALNKIISMPVEISGRMHNLIAMLSSSVQVMLHDPITQLIGFAEKHCIPDAKFTHGYFENVDNDNSTSYNDSSECALLTVFNEFCGKMLFKIEYGIIKEELSCRAVLQEVNLHKRYEGEKFRLTFRTQSGILPYLDYLDDSFFSVKVCLSAASPTSFSIGFYLGDLYEEISNVQLFSNFWIDSSDALDVDPTTVKWSIVHIDDICGYKLTRLLKKNVDENVLKYADFLWELEEGETKILGRQKSWKTICIGRFKENCSFEPIDSGAIAYDDSKVEFFRFCPRI